MHGGGPDLLVRQLLIARPRLGGMPLRGGDALQEGQAEPLGQGRGDDAAASPVGRRDGDQPYGSLGRARGHTGRPGLLRHRDRGFTHACSVRLPRKVKKDRQVSPARAVRFALRRSSLR